MKRSKGTPKMSTIEKTYKYFDLDSMELKSEKVPVEFIAPTSYAEAVTRVGSDESVLLKALTAFLQRSAFKAAGAAIKAKGASKATVFKFAAPWRLAPPYSTIENRADQTKAILDFFKTNPAFVAAIKAASEAADDETEDDGDSDDQN